MDKPFGLNAKRNQMKTDITTVRYDIHDLAEYINWIYFFHAWGFQPRYAAIADIHGCDACRAGWLASFPEAERAKAAEAMQLHKEAVRMLNKIDGKYKVYAIYRLMEANAEGDNLWLEGTLFPLLRQQTRVRPDDPFLCLSDFVRPLSSGIKDTVGGFATTIDPAMEEEFSHDDYQSLLIKTLGERLAEAAAEKIHETLRKEVWGYAKDEKLTMKQLLNEDYQGIRPAVGYPSLPDISVSFLLDKLIDMKRIGIHLTENGMMQPHASVCGILEVMPDGFGFIRSDNYLPGENDVYVSPAQIRRFGLKTGDILSGNTRIKTQSEKFSALLYVTTVNGYHPAEAAKRPNFEELTPIFPKDRIRLEQPGSSTAMRIMDLISPIGKGQRGMIVSPPKAGKTTLLKEVALSVQKTEPDMHLLILLIDERPEEVTDIKEAIEGPNVEVIYSTFDELPEHHKRVSEMLIARAKRLVEHGRDVMILLDSITRLSRAYNLTVPPSGRTLSGGLDPAALYSPKRFFGAARKMREGGSLTILATALVETGSKMDDVVYEEFKGTGNMELMLDRKLQEKRVFPAIDIPRSGTRREDLLLNKEEQEASYIIRKALNGMKAEEAADNLINMFSRTKSNAELVQQVIRQKFI